MLLATLRLIASALSAQSANIRISSLPFTIFAPGTYVLTEDLSSASHVNTAAINISTAISGPVILDLKGFILTGGGGDSIGISIGIAGANGPNANPITIRNGTLQNFGSGVWAEGFNFAVLSGITLNNLTINLGSGQSGNGSGVIFASVVSSTISNCSFRGGSYGIEDTASGGGNRYINCTFVSTNPLFLTSQNGGIPQILNHCQFDGPSAN